MESIIFLSYATSDRTRVEKYYEFLRSKGFDVWIDYKKIKGGQNWDFEIKRALNKSSIIIIFISNNSITKRGYVQREIKLALNKYEEKVSDDIYIVRVILDDDVDIPSSLKDVQFVRASNPKCLEEIEDSITYQLEQLGVEIKRSQENSHLTWSIVAYKDSWDGLPGYEIDIGFINFISDEYAKVSDINDYIRGVILGSCMSMREVKFEIDTGTYNYGQEKQYRSNTYDAHCGEPNIVGKMLFLNYEIHTYFSGAAHPNMHFSTFCFMLDPLIRVNSLSEMFLIPDDAFPIVQKITRSLLLKALSEVDESKSEEVNQFDFYKEWIDRGTEKWEDFNSFVIRGEKLEILFSPYAVASYADGPQVVQIDIYDIAEYMKNHILCALDMENIGVRRAISEFVETTSLTEGVITPPPSA